MSPISRREVALAAAGALLAPLPNFATARSTFRGVVLGVQSYSFRDRPLKEAIAAMAKIGFGSCEMSGSHLEPRLRSVELREWRLTVPLDHFAAAGKTLRAAGIEPAVLTYNLPSPPHPEAEISRGFEMAKALGAKALSSSTKLSVVPGLDAAAKRYKIRVGLHNHSLIRPEEVTTPDDFSVALRGRSDYIMITLDIGHFVAAGFDPAKYLREHQARVMSAHIKDRKKNQGPNVPFGEGDTPIDQALLYIRGSARKIPCYIEYEYEGRETASEVQKCFDYCKHVLLS
jgi:sugar phosphate isomerase/epimerase